jgi:hypothetical protein
MKPSFDKNEDGLSNIKKHKNIWNLMLYIGKQYPSTGMNAVLCGVQSG